MRQQILIAFFLVIPVMTHAGEIATLLRGDHAVVSYSGITQEYAEAIAATVEAARVVAVGQFGFNMPETITLVVRKNRRERVRLFNDGQNRFSLTVRSEKDLRKPATSGIFHIYGLCHEVGRGLWMRYTLARASRSGRTAMTTSSTGPSGSTHNYPARILAL